MEFANTALRPHLEANQELYRVERIDHLRTTTLAQRSAWTSSASGSRTEMLGSRQARWPLALPCRPTLRLRTLRGSSTISSLTGDLVSLHSPPSFPTWSAKPTGPERCGLAHHFTGTSVTLALFRYSVQEVLDAYKDIEPGAAAFAAPTVLDQPMSNVYFSAPKSSDVGHAVGLAPQSDCAHLAAEIIHATMDYRPEHWVAVGTLNEPELYPADIGELRDMHLQCLRRTPGNADYGSNCVA